jgi:hypothetical protein
MRKAKFKLFQLFGNTPDSMVSLLLLDGRLGVIDIVMPSYWALVVNHTTAEVLEMLMTVAKRQVNFFHYH